MDLSSPKSTNLWFPELEDVDDQMLLQDFVGDCLLDYPPEDMNALMDDLDIHYTLSAGSEWNSSTATGDINTTAPKRQKRTNENPTSPNINSDSNAVSDQHSSVQQHDSLSPEDTDNRLTGSTTKATKRPRRLPDQCRNHIIAERQRRQNLSQRFIALSALIPGLKKMDKTSVLGEAITHMRQLKERVNILEAENARRSVESVVVVQRSRIVVENESNSSSGNDSVHSGLTQDEQQLPEIEARFSNRSVLIKIHCHMRTGVLSEILDQIENINLLIVNTSSMAFNNTTLDITITTKMEPDFDMKPQEVVANLRSIF